jgi:hypothetical protein
MITKKECFKEPKIKFSDLDWKLKIGSIGGFVYLGLFFLVCVFGFLLGFFSVI